MKHIGIVACSGEGAVLCYRTIVLEASKKLGEYVHPQISMNSYSFAEYMKHIKAGSWEKVADIMLHSAEKLAKIGVDFAICPDNTIHQAFDKVIKKSPIPWLHIAEVVAVESIRRKYRMPFFH